MNRGKVDEIYVIYKYNVHVHIYNKRIHAADAGKKKYRLYGTVRIRT